MVDRSHWIIQERPGYFGERRDSLMNLWDETFGISCWALAWQWGNKFLEMRDALTLYEDAYFQYFKNNPDTMKWLVNTASDVYDTDESNVNSGLDYIIGDTPSNHIHDIAIRRSLYRHHRQDLEFNKEYLKDIFKGDHLVHVRKKNTEAGFLSPGNVPFHMPEMISKEKIENHGLYGKEQWWKIGSIEDFYQKNKLLIINPDCPS
jgi:hypothetical protein